jgi:hypothetical protein
MFLKPSVYLKEVFTRLPAAICVEDIEALLPWNIAKVVFRLLRFNKNLVTKSQLLKS